MRHSYPAKLLLFGEYTVLSGSRALAIPLPLWQGEWRFEGDAPDPDLVKLYDHLDTQNLFTSETRAHFRKDVTQGLQFESNIPQGFGAGSSGALCAAIIDRYFSHAIDKTNIPALRKSLAALESHFHGKSSGMDPLVSLMNAPILREMEAYHILSPVRTPENLQLFLLDSGKARSTEVLVGQYTTWTTDEMFRIECLRPLIQSVDHAISFFLEGHVPMLWEHLRIISELQFRYFRPMITEFVDELWMRTLSNPSICLKLCGAGGGGFYLGFARNDVDIGAVCGQHILL